MAGILYIVATPSAIWTTCRPRIATFGAADFVAAEDTRVTMRLLNYLGLKSRWSATTSTHCRRAMASCAGLRRANCALCSDAGMPCVWTRARSSCGTLAQGIKVVPVPAASACVTALAVSAGHLPLGVRGLSAREPEAERASC